jgi:uncharacterized protein YycO
MKVLLFKGRGIISWSIRWFTRSQYSHAAIQVQSGQIFEAWQGAGVRVTTLRSWKDVDVFEVDVTLEQRQKIHEFLEGELGCGYDYWGIWGFVSRQPRRSNKKWFCSELVAAAFEEAGISLLGNNTPSWAVSPAMLATSPLLKRAGRVSHNAGYPN